MCIEITRQACCSQDDQMGPLEMTFDVQPNNSLRSLVAQVIERGFLQYSSTHTTMIGTADGIDIVRVNSPYYKNEQPEYLVDPELPISEVTKNGSIHFRF